MEPSRGTMKLNAMEAAQGWTPCTSRAMLLTQAGLRCSCSCDQPLMHWAICHTLPPQIPVEASERSAGHLCVCKTWKHRGLDVLEFSLGDGRGYKNSFSILRLFPHLHASILPACQFTDFTGLTSFLKGRTCSSPCLHFLRGPGWESSHTRTSFLR